MGRQERMDKRTDKRMGNRMQEPERMEKRVEVATGQGLVVVYGEPRPAAVNQLVDALVRFTVAKLAG